MTKISKLSIVAIIINLITLTINSLNVIKNIQEGNYILAFILSLVVVMIISALGILVLAEKKRIERDKEWKKEWEQLILELEE